MSQPANRQNTNRKDYASVTSAYWAFTLTDGALRMLVLLHFHALGFTPLDLAFLFLLYEAMGIVTNFFGGWLGARFGLRFTLYGGLIVQIIALLMLTLIDAGWSTTLSVAYVMAAQALSGVAKDLTKMSSKSAVKLVATPKDGTSGDNISDDNILFRWVAILTGSKNALKGLGFLLGGLLLSWLGFTGALLAMCGLLVLALAYVLLFLKGDLGRAKSKPKGRDLWAKTPEINWLSAARIFLFASRDVWFVVALPVFLYESLGWGFDQVGGFMALWVIGYGIVQASVPGFLKQAGTARSGSRAAGLWAFLLTLLTAFMAFGLTSPALPSNIVLLGGLLIFAVIFAVNSAVHSFLIVALSDHDKVALNVGFYYMANAAGRLLGTLLSGLVFQMAGLTACLITSAILTLLAAGLVLPISRYHRPASP